MGCPNNNCYKDAEDVTPSCPLAKFLEEIKTPLACSYLYHDGLRAHQCHQPTDSSQTLHCWRALEA